jgi:hypothetical protein
MECDMLLILFPLAIELVLVALHCVRHNLLFNWVVIMNHMRI